MKGNGFIDRNGERNVTNEGCEIKIVEYKNARNCTIQFLDTGNFKKTTYSSFKKGSLSNPLFKNISFVGFLGEGEYSSKNNRKCYNTWRGIIYRCYSERSKLKHPTYKDVTVCKAWHNFQNFAKWFYENQKEYMDESWDLDKDILVKGNKIYSPDTCCFVPKEINVLFTKRQNDRGNYPIGVSYNKPYRKYCVKFVGYFDTPQEAFKAYKTVKEEHIKEVADKWEDLITSQTYQALYNYQVEITD